MKNDLFALVAVVPLTMLFLATAFGDKYLRWKGKRKRSRAPKDAATMEGE